MPRTKRELKLTPVDDLAQRPPVIRLESRGTLESAKLRRSKSSTPDAEISARLDVPSRDEIETRTHEPEMNLRVGRGPSMMETWDDLWDPDFHERNRNHWIWLIFSSLLLAGLITWSLSKVEEPDDEADQIREVASPKLAWELAETLEAGALIDRIEAATRQYLATTDPATLAKLSRHPERVAPLMASHYQAKPISPVRVARTRLLQPVDLARLANFWEHTVELENRETRNLIIEILPTGEPRIDWEALVGYQPMHWDDFAHTRPAGVEQDFRVYLEKDHFFCHEFADSARWHSFRLTVPNSLETLFGYIENGSPLLEDILKLFDESKSQKIPVTLRLGFPTGFASPRGVVIHQIASPRWFYLGPPEG